jgi:hypothetical protein
MKPNVIAVKACELLDNPAIVERVAAIKAGLEAKMQKRFVVTIERVVDELAKIGFDERDDHRTVVNKLGALDKLGKHLGMFVNKTEHTGKDGAPLLPENTASPRELARAIMDIFRSAATENKDDPQ